jgi:hypothetical protein
LNTSIWFWRTGRGSIFAAFVIIAFASAVSMPTRAQEKAPNVTANADGSCVYHKNLEGGREDIAVANGATYHQEEKRGRKSGIIYLPDRMYLCKDGHFSRVKE